MLLAGSAEIQDWRETESSGWDTREKERFWRGNFTNTNANDFSLSQILTQKISLPLSRSPEDLPTCLLLLGVICFFSLAHFLLRSGLCLCLCSAHPHTLTWSRSFSLALFHSLSLLSLSHCCHWHSQQVFRFLFSVSAIMYLVSVTRLLCICWLNSLKCLTFYTISEIWLAFLIPHESVRFAPCSFRFVFFSNLFHFRIQDPWLRQYRKISNRVKFDRLAAKFSCLCRRLLPVVLLNLFYHTANTQNALIWPQPQNTAIFLLLLLNFSPQQCRVFWLKWN